MGDQSAIEWTEATWGPIVGCSRVSEGCRNCYAEREAAGRLSGTPKYEGLARTVNGHASWTGELRLWEAHLDLPLRWRRPRRIFVNSMSDLFHEAVPDEWIDRIFAVMANCRDRHTFQILTKRPERMLRYMTGDQVLERVLIKMLLSSDGKGKRDVFSWPLPNVWLGVSVEDQPTADARIPLLLQTPAAVRWVSYEPALGPVDWEPFVWRQCIASHRIHEAEHGGGLWCDERSLDWLVVGGESGPGARPFDVDWARVSIAQCKAAGVPIFVKQLGARPFSMQGGYGDPFFGAKLLSPSGQDEAARWYPSDPMRDRKCGDPAEWPKDLRAREYPR